MPPYIHVPDSFTSKYHIRASTLAGHDFLLTGNFINCSVFTGFPSHMVTAMAWTSDTVSAPAPAAGFTFYDSIDNQTHPITAAILSIAGNELGKTQTTEDNDVPAGLRDDRFPCDGSSRGSLR
jgi:hypothetical protein